MNYDWDPKKAAANLAKHGIDFRGAIRIFDGPIIEWLDDRFEYDEERWTAIGLVEKTEIVVVYSEKGENLRRIISARRATPAERRLFWRGVTR